MVKYGKLVGGRMVYAPTSLGNKANPTWDDYLAAGWKRVFPPKSAPRVNREGYHAELDGWTEQARAVVPKWKVVEDSAYVVPKRYSKMKLYIALCEAGLWDALESWMGAQILPNGVNVLKAYDNAQELNDQHPLFSQFLAAAKEAIGATDEQVAQVLAAAEVE